MGAGELADLFDVSKPTMSAHFAVLVAAGLIEPDKHGRSITYRLRLSVLEDAVPRALDALAVGGRIVVLAYQSLEDRIVKRALQAATSSTAPLDLPAELPEHAPHLRLLVKGAELADEAERAANPRSAPVRLRAAQRIRPASLAPTTGEPS